MSWDMDVSLEVKRRKKKKKPTTSVRSAVGGG